MDRLEELYMKWNLPKAADILAYTPDEFREMLKDNYFAKNAERFEKLIRLSILRFSSIFFEKGAKF